MSCQCKCNNNNDNKITRRGFLWSACALLAATAGSTALATVRFIFPNTLNEPTNMRKIGFITDYKPGIDERFLKSFGVFIVREEEQMYAISSKCTHLGCTPRWLSAQQEFQCPCHGSKFYPNGINFAGPAPRALDRVKIAIADDGQILLDKSQLFVCDMAKGKDEWQNEGAYLKV
ncbi:MAG: Rieske 2Fe-2S domain-containing protein [Candidatus Desantisbacteria bacterium]